MPQVNDDRIPTNYNNQGVQRIQRNTRPDPYRNVKEWARENINPRTLFGIMGIICLLPIIIPIMTMFLSVCHWIVHDHTMIAHTIVAITVILNILVRL